MSSYVGSEADVARLPRNYGAILDAIRGLDRGAHVTAQELYLRVRRERPAIGFATVHRGLTRLHELGYVLKVDVPGAAAAVYECAAAPHAHFRCIACGSIADVEFTVSNEQLAELSERLGLQIAGETTTFAGRCAACAADDRGA